MGNRPRLHLGVLRPCVPVAGGRGKATQVSECTCFYARSASSPRSEETLALPQIRRGPPWPRSPSSLRRRRQVFFEGCFVDTPVYDGERAGHGHRIEGPAIVE